MTHAWKGGKDGMTRERLRSIFDQNDIDGSGYLEREEVVSAMVVSGIVISKVNNEIH
jgi:Ca2+-binding EF-hand superfamily protein